MAPPARTPLAERRLHTEGWLQRHATPHEFSGFVKLWMVLSGHSLQSFWDPEDAKMRDEIDTRGCVVQAVEEGFDVGHGVGAPAGMALFWLWPADAPDSAGFIFASPDPAECARWIQAIRASDSLARTPRLDCLTLGLAAAPGQAGPSDKPSEGDGHAPAQSAGSHSPLRPAAADGDAAQRCAPAADAHAAIRCPAPLMGDVAGVKVSMRVCCTRARTAHTHMHTLTCTHTRMHTRAMHTHKHAHTQTCTRTAHARAHTHTYRKPATQRGSVCLHSASGA
jgi:hypothetical protein